MSSPLTGRPVCRAAVASVATLALLGLSACGSDDAGSKAADTSSSSTAASSSPVATSSKPAAGSDVSAADMTALFAAAFSKATSAHVTLKSEGGAFPLTAEGDASFGDPVAMQMTMNLASMGQAEVRLVDKTIYMKLPMLGEKFIKFDLDDPSNPLGSSFTDQLDPAQLTKSLQGAITKATYVGNETVAGDQLDHYTLQVDSQKMLANSGASLPSSGAAGKGALPDAITIDMWFDDQGQVRQVRSDLGAQGGTFTGTFSNYGEKVDVQAPPASQVTDMPALPTSVPSS